MAVTDARGSVVETYNYTPYGELIDGEYREDIPFLYNGQYGVTTDNNGLYYMRARYYNVEIKRFINQDVLLGVLERVSSLNRYSYVEGNPISYLDPFGLERVWTKELHEIAFKLLLANVVITFLSPQVGEIFGVLISCFDLGLTLYDIYGDFKDERYFDALSDFGKALLSVLGIFTAGTVSLAKYDYELLVEYEACKASAINLVKQLKTLRETREKVNAVSWGVTIFDKLKEFVVSSIKRKDK